MPTLDPEKSQKNVKNDIMGLFDKVNLLKIFMSSLDDMAKFCNFLKLVFVACKLSNTEWESFVLVDSESVVPWDGP